MKNGRLGNAVPVFIIIYGLSLLIDEWGIVPEVDWVKTVGTGAVGAMIVFIWGVNRISIVLGPLLFIASVCLFFKQVGCLHTTIIGPVLIIFIGIFVLIGRLIPIRSSKPVLYCEELHDIEDGVYK